MSAGWQTLIANPSSLPRLFLMVGFIFFAAAILLHHNLNLASMARDVAIYPAAVFVAAALWKNRRWIYAVAAVVIALPSFAFLDNPSLLMQPEEVKPFLNQLFLLAAGICAVFAGSSLFRKRSRAA